MSLILEALKRSEAERRLGEAPDLLAPPPEFVAAAPARGLPKTAVAVLAVAVIGVAVAVWWFAVRDAVSVAPAANRAPVDAESNAPIEQPLRAAPAVAGSPALLGAPVVQNPVAAASPAPIAAPQMPPDPTAPLLPPDTVEGRSPVPVEPQAAVAAIPMRQPADAAAISASASPGAGVVEPSASNVLAAAQPAQIIAATTPEVADADVAAAPVAAAPPPPEAIPESPASDLPDLSDLPLAVRQSLPPLVLNMHLYRATASERVVILDGKRLREGDSVGDLQVAEIRSDGVVLVAQGQRFLLSRLPR